MPSSTTFHNFCGRVVYQIYPRSFKDTNGQGVGDLAGITQKLDYLAWLGVGALWISPFYKSPMADFGYDVADHTVIDPLFGTMEDFETLLSQAHKRNILVLIDFVPNHTSDEHAWFQESRSSKGDPKRDWYIWRDPAKDGGPPNNWLSVFGGSAWEFDEQTGQYYLHSFLKQQPDLNWSNPKVRKAMKDILHYWLNKGVDGFRFDAVYWLAKDPKFRDDPPNPHYNPNVDKLYDSLSPRYSRGQETLYNYLNEITDVLTKYKNRFGVIEAYPEPQLQIEGYLDFYKQLDSTVMVPFNFELLHLPWEAQAYKHYIDAFQQHLSSEQFPVYVAGNHDKPRLASRVGLRATRPAAMILATLPGMPFIYYGDEIGMKNTRLSRLAKKDPLRGSEHLSEENRDPQRTPMQWNRRKFAGFSRVTPWLPVARNYKVRDVARQKTNPRSLLCLYHDALKLRQSSLALQFGSYTPVSTTSKHLFAYQRSYKDEILLVVTNFSRKRWIKMPAEGHLVLSTANIKHNTTRLRPLESRIIRPSNPE